MLSIYRILILCYNNPRLPQIDPRVTIQVIWSGLQMVQYVLKPA